MDSNEQKNNDMVPTQSLKDRALQAIKTIGSSDRASVRGSLEITPESSELAKRIDESEKFKKYWTFRPGDGREAYIVFSESAGE